MDPAVTIRALGDAIFHAHAKDVALNAANIAVNGVLDTKSYRRMPERSWLFRTGAVLLLFALFFRAGAGTAAASGERAGA